MSDPLTVKSVRVARAFGVGLSGALRWPLVLPALFLAIVVIDVVVYAASVRAVTSLSRDMARKVAENRLPEGLVPRVAAARLPLGLRDVRIDTTPGREMVLEFSVGTGDASLFGLVGLVAGDRLTVRSTVIRHPGAIPAVFNQ